MAVPMRNVQGNQLAETEPIDLTNFRTTRQDAATIAYCNSLFESCRQERQRFERQWFMNMAFFFGRHYVQWLGGTPDLQSFARLHEPKAPPWRVRLVINKMRLIIRKELAKVTKETPRGYVIPSSTDDEDLAAARAGDALYEFFWRDLGLSTIERRAIFWTLLCGTAFMKDWFDPDKTDNSGVKGSVVVEPVTPFHVYVPDLHEVEIENQPYVIHALVKDIEWVNSSFKNQVQGESGGNETLESTFLTALGVNNNPKTSQRVAVKELWIKPNNRYKDGALITWAGTQLLNFREGWPYKHNQFPFTKFDHIPTGRFYADSSIIDLIPLQKELNRSRSQMVEAKNRMAKPQLVAPRGSIDPGKITSEPGLIITYTPGYQPPTPIPLTPMPGYVTDEIQRIENDIADVSSQHEVSSGSVPPGVGAATAIAYLQEADDSVLAPTIASLEEGIEKVGRHLLSHVNQFWQAERTIQVVGKNAKFDAFKFSQATLAGNNDFRVESGSATPRSRAAKQAFLMELADKGVITPEQLLKYLEMGDAASLYEESQIDTRQAQRENLLMMQGEEVEINKYDHHLNHLITHYTEMKSQDYETAPEEIQQLVEDHTEGHKAYFAAMLQIPYVPDDPFIDGLIFRIQNGEPLPPIGAFAPAPVGEQNAVGS